MVYAVGWRKGVSGRRGVQWRTPGAAGKEEGTEAEGATLAIG